ncbi:MAG: iron-containing redox enzyme family protein [Myxococcota bacterium]
MSMHPTLLDSPVGSPTARPIGRWGADSDLDPHAYVARLAEETLRHRAVRHPYLRALRDGTLPDMRWALADFGRQYYSYSKHFPRYLTAVIARLEDPAHRRGLMENLTEESGRYEAEELHELAALGIRREWIENIPHPALFQRFCRAMGVEHGEDHVEEAQVVCWRELFLMLLSNGSAAEAVGALGLGTENIVSTIYLPFVDAIERLGLDREDTVFFPLHTAVDDHHQETLQNIAADLAVTPQGQSDLRRGALKALAMRSAFWDWLYERALHPEHHHTTH